ncbi:hypothetical protein DV738_g1955, partial [Chaetothyriales sp. CBS 135597]
MSSTSTTSSGSDSDQPGQSGRGNARRSRSERPRLAERQRSSSIIVPKGHLVQEGKLVYPPDDARAMSPRRNSEDLEKLEKDVRQSLREQARTLQSSLAALAERIDEVKSDHDRLESENRFLQDYIGGLTKTMAKDNNLARSGSLSGRKKNRK